MKTHIKVGQSIIKKSYEYFHSFVLDDDEEFIPLLRLLIDGILEHSEDVENDRKLLVDYSGELYVEYLLDLSKGEEYFEYDECKKSYTKQMKEIFGKL